MSQGRQSPSVLPLVIVMHENEAVLGSLKLALEIEGFAVHTYTTWNGVFDDAGFSDCACLIIDQKLPGLDGIGLVAALRKGRMAAPVVVISGEPTTSLRDRAARLGVPIVEKPLVGSQLLERVRDVVARHPRLH
jgi:FixJ family two-component response regulator